MASLYGNAGADKCPVYLFPEHINNIYNAGNITNYHPSCDVSLWVSRHNIPKVLQLSSVKYTKHCRHTPVHQIVCNSGNCPIELDCILKTISPEKNTWKCYETKIGKNKDHVAGNIYFESCHGNRNLDCINSGSFHFRQDGCEAPRKLGEFMWNNKLWVGNGPCVNDLKSTPCGCDKCVIIKHFVHKSERSSTTDDIIGSILQGGMLVCICGVILIVSFLLGELFSECFACGLFMGGIGAAVLLSSDTTEGYTYDAFEAGDFCDD